MDGPHTYTDAHAQLHAIAEVVSTAESQGAQVWLRGGWAVDFCIGRITRSHNDIDFYTLEPDHRALVDQLIAAGWKRDRRLPIEQQADLSRVGVELSINPVRMQNGCPVVGPGPWAGVPLPADLLADAGVGVIEGVRAAYISPSAQITMKQMTPVWQPDRQRRDKDAADIALLCRCVEQSAQCPPIPGSHQRSDEDRQPRDG